MRILLTNDDGIKSPGILLLADELRKAGHRVFTVAPATDQSGVSHSVTFFNGPRKLTAIKEDTWSCDGTPADCIVVGLLGGIPELNIRPDPESGSLPSPPDIILSGINRGANMGTDIVYSGTAAGARQGGFCGVPSAALSLADNIITGNIPAGIGRGSVWHWETAVAFIIKHLEEIMSYWKSDSFLNVNIPNRKEMPVSLVRAFPSIRCYNDRIRRFTAPDGQLYCFTESGVIGAKAEKGSDYDVVEGNSASLSEIYIHPVLRESVKGGEDALHKT